MSLSSELDQDLLSACRTYLKQIPDNLGYITPPELNTVLENDPDSVFLLDNRTPAAYRAGHIHGAVNLWLKDALDDENLGRIPADKRIVVCCWVGHTASQLMTMLRLLGYDAIALKYGMGTPANPAEAVAGWAKCGLPVESGDPS